MFDKKEIIIGLTQIVFLIIELFIAEYRNFDLLSLSILFVHTILLVIYYKKNYGGF